MYCVQLPFTLCQFSLFTLIFILFLFMLLIFLICTCLQDKKCGACEMSIDICPGSVYFSVVCCMPVSIAVFTTARYCTFSANE